MLIPVIYVIEKDGTRHLAGTNTHDALFVDDASGGIQYMNLQSCRSTVKEGGPASYRFEGKTAEYSPYPLIRFVTIEEYFELYKEEVHLACQDERQLRDFIKKFAEERAEAIKENRLDEDDDIRHTGGTII